MPNSLPIRGSSLHNSSSQGNGDSGGAGRGRLTVVDESTAHQVIARFLKDRPWARDQARRKAANVKPQLTAEDGFSGRFGQAHVGCGPPQPWGLEPAWLGQSVWAWIRLYGHLLLPEVDRPDWMAR